MQVWRNFPRWFKRQFTFVGIKSGLLTESALKLVCIPHLRGRRHKNNEIAGTAFYFLCLKEGLPYLFHSFRNKYFNKISLGNMLYFQNKL